MTETRNRSSPRLRFSKEELENPELAQKAEKAEQAADRYDAAKKKLQTRRLKLIAEEVQTEQDAMQQIEADAAELHEPASPSGEPSQQKKQASNVYYFPYQKRLEVYPLHVASSNNIYGDTSRETINSFFKMYGSSETAFYARVSEVFETALIENWRTGNPTTLFQDTLGEFETVYKEVEN